MSETSSKAAVAIGVFDGVHRGHQDLVQRMLQHARANDLRGVCVTFDPDPEIVLRPERPHLALSSTEERIRLLKSLGVDQVEVIPFTREVSLKSPEEFVDALAQKHPLESLWIGSNFALGHDRTGTVETLKRIGADKGFSVHPVDLLEHDGRPVTASWIRECLTQGNVALARELLGRPYQIRGVVVAGMRRGRELGFPTANVVPPAGRAIPADGVYFVQAGISGARTGGVDGDAGFGVVNLGPRPTFDEKERLLEVHLLEFAGDLYGAELRVCFLEQLRQTVRFPNFDALRAQIDRDVAKGRELARAWAGIASCG